MSTEGRATTLAAPDDNQQFLSRLASDPATRDDFEDAREISDAVQTLARIRKGAGLRQRDVATQMNTSTSVISNIENEVHDPRVSTLTSYARAVGARLTLQVNHQGVRWTSNAGSWRASPSPQFEFVNAAGQTLPAAFSFGAVG